MLLKFSRLISRSYQNIYMRARNADQVDKMISRYPQLQGPDGIAKVFCVANKDYEGEEFDNRSTHFEAIKGSGIPELRRFCRSVVARAQFQACDYFLQFDVPNLVQSLQAWLDAYAQTPHPPSLSHVIDPIQQVSNSEPLKRLACDDVSKGI